MKSLVERLNITRANEAERLDELIAASAGLGFLHAANKKRGTR